MSERTDKKIFEKKEEEKEVNMQGKINERGQQLNKRIKK